MAQQRADDASVKTKLLTSVAAHPTASRANSSGSDAAGVVYAGGIAKEADQCEAHGRAERRLGEQPQANLDVAIGWMPTLAGYLRLEPEMEVDEGRAKKWRDYYYYFERRTAETRSKPAPQSYEGAYSCSSRSSTEALYR